jgi:tetrahydromethanopterin S-methyltransferase subunit B
MTTAALSSIKILLAEANPVEFDRIRSNVDREFRDGIQVVQNYEDLLSRLTLEIPQILLIGRIDKFNYFDICKECHKLRQNLPIFLISREEKISESFRSLAITRGLTDVVDPDPVQLTKLFQTIAKLSQIQPARTQSLQPIAKPIQSQPARERSSELPVVGETMLTWLEKIVAISNNYFGPLAQGNYWRKTHTQILDEFPLLANWSVDHFGKISCQESILARELTDEDIQCLRVWVQMFIQECQRIIIDFESILNNSDLSLLAKTLLIKSS